MDSSAVCGPCTSGVDGADTGAVCEGEAHLYRIPGAGCIHSPHFNNTLSMWKTHYNCKKGWQWAFNVTARRVRATIVEAENQ